MFVPDRYEAAGWYRRVLGLNIEREYEFWAQDAHGPLMISSDGGSTKLALFQGTPQGSRPTAGYHRVAFRVDGGGFLDFLGRLERLDLLDDDGRRVTPEQARDHDRSYSIYFCDPWGHRLDVTTYDHEDVSQRLRG